MGVRLLSVLVALVAVGCASVEAAPVAVTQPVEAAPVAAEPSCEVVFSPDQALEAEVSVSAERWAAATGCDVRVEAGGWRVELVAADDARLWSEKAGKFMMGRTLWTPSGVPSIVVSPSRIAAVMPHEMGHALGHSGNHAAEDGQIMNGSSVTDCISAADLEFVCSALDCSAFAAESCAL